MFLTLGGPLLALQVDSKQQSQDVGYGKLEASPTRDIL